MTNPKLKTQTKNIILIPLATLMIFLFSSCAVITASLSSSLVPESKGLVKIKRDEFSNYVININLSDLENVRKLQPSKETYVVWMEANKKVTKNLGQIRGSDTWISKKSKASFDAVSEFKPTKIFITAEDEPMIQKPGTQVVWSTNSF